MKFAQIIIFSLLPAMLSSCSPQSVKTETAVTEKAHIFTLPDQNGTMTSLEEILKNQKGAVLAFYPKDDSKN